MALGQLQEFHTASEMILQELRKGKLCLTVSKLDKPVQGEISWDILYVALLQHYKVTYPYLEVVYLVIA